ncbi:MAG: hypothetical protein ACUVQ1_09690 [Candidatus Kapaibacteriales bacterium]
MLKNLDELATELTALQTKYAENPFKEYAKDPLWKNYFEDLADNIAIVKERVEKKQDRLVQNCCSNFCRILDIYFLVIIILYGNCSGFLCVHNPDNKRPASTAYFIA